MQAAEGFSRAARQMVFAAALALSLLAPTSALALVRGVTPPAPAPSAGLAAPAGLTVTAGDMTDSLRWFPVRSTTLAGYRIERAADASGPWSLLSTRTSATLFSSRVPSARLWYYRVFAVSRSGALGAPSSAISNETLALSAVVGSRGATLRASNGALSLTLPRGTFARSTRVSVRPASAPGAPSLVRVTPAYDFYASAALKLPAKVTIRYRIPVSHFQVANTVARGVDWMCYDAAASKWTPVATLVDTTAGTITASMPHFSWWTGAYTQPHGTTPTKTDYCGTVCHNLAISPLPASGAIAITDSQVCYYCHGNAVAATTGAGSNGANIQAQLYACSGQTLPAGSSAHPARLPGTTTGLKCTSCHDPHADPVKSPKLLRAFDAVTGRAIASANGTTPGSAYCWACHGARKNAAVDAAVSGYWTRTGNKKINLLATPHDLMTTPDGKGCSACHTGHASTTGSLVRTTIAGTTVTNTGRSLCDACHAAAAGTYPGEAVFAATGHGKTSGLTGQALARWPGRSSGTAGDCANCHDPHGTGNADYTRAAGSALCAGCHDDASIVRPASASYCGGVAYAASAHGVATCADCHAVHGVLVDGAVQPALLRASEQDGCLRCHSAAGGGSTIPGSKPYTWNGRDIAVEFARPSHHPLRVSVGTWWWETETVTAMSQTRASEFDSDTKSQMSAVSTYGPELAWASYNVDPGVRRLLYAVANETKVWQQYDPELNAWNAWNYNPPDPTVTGGRYNSGNAVFAGGRIYLEEASGQSGRGVYVPADGTVNGVWLANSNMPGYTGEGGDATVDEAAGLVYYTRGTAYSTIYKWRYTDSTWQPTISAQTSTGSAIDLHKGASAAYSPLADKLFIVRRQGNLGDGMLYSLAAPSGKSGNQAFANTGLRVTRNDATIALTQMARFRRGGVDYLGIIGQDDANTLQLQVISDLGSATPTRTRTGKPPWAVDPGVGFQLEWDGGDYLYACDYHGTGNYLSRVRIPNDPVAGTWPGWESLPLWSGGGSGASMTFADARPKPYDVVGYRLDGWIATEAVAPAGATAWGSLDWSADTPGATSITIKVQGWNGSTFEDIFGYGAITARSADLSGIPIAGYSRLRIVASFHSATTAVTPRLTAWAVSAVRTPAFGSSASAGCVRCHDAHAVRAGTGAWDAGRMSDPGLRSAIWADGSMPDTTAFCLTCHSGRDLSSSGVAFTALATPFFPGWIKDGGTTSFMGSGHFATSGTKALCENCHDPHGSQNQRLVAWTAPGSWAGAAAGSRDNTTTAAFEQNLCYQCHGNGTVGRKAPGAQDVASPASGAYSHPIATVSGIHRDIETTVGLGATARHSECIDCHDPHAARPGLHVEGSSRPGPALRGATGVKPVYSPTAAPGDTASSFQTVRMTGVDGDREAYVCLKCHSAATTRPTTGGTTGFGTTDLAAEFNPANYSFHNVLGQPVGIRSSFSVLSQTTTWGRPGWQVFATGWNSGSQMTCTSCHSGGTAGQAKGPHGSSVKYGIDPAYPGDWETAGLDFRNANGVSDNIICLKCHVFRDGGSNSVHGADGVMSNVHTKAAWGGTYCIGCHIRIPHGWKRPRMIGYATDPEPYRTHMSDRSGILAVSIRSHAADVWFVYDCQVGCSSTHITNGFAGPVWP